MNKKNDYYDMSPAKDSLFSSSSAGGSFWSSSSFGKYVCRMSYRRVLVWGFTFFFGMFAISLIYISLSFLKYEHTTNIISPLSTSWSKGQYNMPMYHPSREQFRQKRAEVDTLNPFIKKLQDKVDSVTSKLNEVMEESKNHLAHNAGDGEVADLSAPNLSQHYVGCYQDSFLQRQFPEIIPSFFAEPLRCMPLCNKKGFKYAALQSGSECWCGNQLNSSTVLKERFCNRQCSGNANYFCGASMVNSVYEAADLQDNSIFESSPLKAVTLDSSVNVDSSIWCSGTNRTNRICKFKNLYLLPDITMGKARRKQYMFHRGPNSIIKNLDELVKAENNTVLKAVLDLSSVDNIYALDILVVDQLDTSLLASAMQIEEPALHFCRFLPPNIMHVIHDDLLNVFVTLAQHTFARGEFPYDPDTRIILLDNQGPGDYLQLLQHMMDQPLLHITDLIGEATVLRSSLIQFQSGIIGINKDMNWYQYGYSEPQGRIKGKEINGYLIRQFSDFLLSQLPETTAVLNTIPIDDKRLFISDLPESSAQVLYPTASDGVQDTIVIFSRTFNRKILNEKELIFTFQRDFPHLKVALVRLEQYDVSTIIHVLKRAKVVVGMHGSILILTMFTPVNSTVIELYPFAVPSDNYTPYRIMANFEGIELKYHAWENKYENNSIAHPDEIHLRGGIKHLPAEEQTAIINTKTVPSHKCCENPYWLFRIYQDTIVNCSEISAIIREDLKAI